MLEGKWEGKCLIHVRLEINKYAIISTINFSCVILGRPHIL